MHAQARNHLGVGEQVLELSRFRTAGIFRDLFTNDGPLTFCYGYLAADSCDQPKRKRT